MPEKSLVAELQQVQLAIELIELGARLQVLEYETELSRSRLIQLYKETKGFAPRRGWLPLSTGWFITGQPHIHSSLFYNYYRQLDEAGGRKRIDCLVKAYRQYIEQTQASSDEHELVLDMTRAWTLLQFIDNGRLEVAPCQPCGNLFVVLAHSPVRHYACATCRSSSRASK